MKDRQWERSGHPGGHHGHGPGDEHAGAQTFRRRRAIDFLQRLDVKRATLLAQLDRPELASIHPVISGELKAIELVRNEFIHAFELNEAEGRPGTAGGPAPEAPSPDPPRGG